MSPSRIVPPTPLLPILLAAAVWPSSYFVDPRGDDSLAGTTPSTAWRTLARLGSDRLRPGDTANLARDGIWRESLRIPTAGTASDPIVVQPYGSGSEPPLLLGSVSVSAPDRGGIHSAKVPGPVQGVLWKNQPLPMARHPDTGWLVADALEDDSTLRSDALASVDWTGASILLRSSPWTLETHRILQGTGGRLRLEGRFVYRLDSVRFYLANHPAALGGGPGWYQSSADSVLHWKGPPGESADTVEAAVREVGIDLRGSHFVEVSGISARSFRQKGVWSDGTGIHLEGLDLRFPGLVGVQLNGRRSRLRGSRIVGANGKAVSTTGPGQILYGNRISRTGMREWLGPDGLGKGCCNGAAIETNGDSTIVRRNQVDSSGLNAITFKGQASRIDSNHLAHSCMTVEDCGTIHTWAGRYPNTGSANSAIRHNIVRDAVGAPSGLRRYFPSFQGIYLDDGSHDILVDSNVVFGNHCGIFLHNTQDVQVRGNLVFGNRSCQVLLQHDTLAGPVDMTGNRLVGNILVSMPDQEAIRTQITRPQSSPLADILQTTLCRDQMVEVGCQRDSIRLWRRERIAAQHPSLGTEQLVNFGFDSTRSGWPFGPPRARQDLDSGTACPRGKCLRLSNGQDSLQRGAYTHGNPAIRTETGRWWRLGFRAKGARFGQPLGVLFRRSYGDYASFAKIPTILLDTVWTDHAFLLRSTQTDERTRVDFTMPFAETSFWLDEASFRTVEDSLARSLPSSALALGAPEATVPDGSGLWLDVDGKPTIPSDPGDYRGQALFRISRERDPLATRGRTRVGWSVRHSGNSLVFQDLDQPVVLRDPRGRTIARLEPDSHGRASFPSNGAGLLWATSGGRTRAAVRIP